MRRHWLALALAATIALPAYADGPQTQSSVALIAPTPPVATNNNQIATTAYVNNVLNGNVTIGGNLTVGGAIIDNTNGISLNNPTGGLKGAGTINIAADYYKNGTVIPETVSAPLSLSAGGNVSCPTCVLISGTGRGDSAYSILSTDRYVYTNAAFTAPRTWTLPAANSITAGTTIWVQDARATVTSTNTLTIARAGADTIDFAGTSLVITGAGGGITFTSDGVSNWGTPIQTVSTGGTGQQTLTNHGLLVGAGTNPVTQLGVGANGTLLLGQTGADPAFNTMSGDVTITNAGVTAIGANKVTRAMEAQGVARSVIGVTGNATANVADIQGTANQALIVNSAGTALAFGSTRQIIGFSNSTIVQTQASTVFQVFLGGASEAGVQVLCPIGGTFKNLFVLTSAPAAGQTVIATLRVNSADTAITCTVTGTGTTCSDTTHTATCTAGQPYSLKTVTSATSGSIAAISAGVEFDNP